MTSKIKVDNINKVSDDSNIINKCGTNITMGVNGDTVILPNGVTEQVQSGAAIQVQSGGSITIASGATITNNGTAVGLGRTGTVDWNTTPKTGTFTAVSGDGFFLNTSGGVITANLPAGVAGAIVSFADYAGTWQTNNVTVTPNGTDKIGSQNQNATLNIEGQSVTFVFVDSTQGWINTMDSTSNVRGTPPFIAATGGTVTCEGNFKIHTFTGPGTFQVTRTATSAPQNKIDYLVVAGGGSSTGTMGSGGGAGGFRLSNDTCMSAPQTSPLATPTGITASVASFPIVIGAGGTRPNPNSPGGTVGNVSSGLGISSAGGGGGVAAGQDGQNGGSGSGGGGEFPGRVGAGGTGDTPSVSPPQGNDGGTGGQAPSNRGAGGGGGAGGAGAAGNNDGGVGGIGSFVVATGFGGSNGEAGPVSGARYFAGGGGGGFESQGGQNGAGGIGGGGDGGPGPGTNPGNGQDGVTNTGGGGGGASRGGPGTGAGQLGGSGGSGIVVIRYRFQ